jgi:hypothetical protein
MWLSRISTPSESPWLNGASYRLQRPLTALHMLGASILLVAQPDIIRSACAYGGVAEYRGAELLRLDVGRSDHLVPLPSFVADELPELSG